MFKTKTYHGIQASVLGDIDLVYMHFALSLGSTIQKASNYNLRNLLNTVPKITVR